MPYSVSLTTRNTLNPNPQLGNFGQRIESKAGEIEIASFLNQECSSLLIIFVNCRPEFERKNLSPIERTPRDPRLLPAAVISPPFQRLYRLLVRVLLDDLGESASHFEAIHSSIVPLYSER